MLPIASLPADPPSPPKERAPAGACDAHLHLVAAPGTYLLYDKRIEDPGAGDLDVWLGRYRRVMATIGTCRAVLVQSILYGTDNSLTTAAIAALGRDCTRGIGLVSDGAPETALDALAEDGFVGIRLNYVHGGVLSFDGATALAPALAARGMHLQMLVHTHQHLVDLEPALRTFPVPVVIDHLGWPNLSFGTADPGFQALCRLLAGGNVWVKLSGVYRVDLAGSGIADPFVAALVAANAERCLWGSDWPHLMLGPAAMADAGQLLDAFHRAVPNTAHRQRVLVDNPAALFGFTD